MALLEEDLPGVNKVRTDFQLREDQGLAHRLQEQEFEDHFNANVQLRRTARHDVNIAKSIQDRENESFQKEESARRQELRAREEQDSAHAAEMAKLLDQEERKLRERELADQEHAAKIAEKLKEEEEIQKALRMQDEIVARKLQEAEAKRQARKKRQEEEDALLARQSSQEHGLSDREVQRLKELQLQGRRDHPQSSLQPRGTQRVQQDSKQVTSSLPTNLGAPQGAKPAPQLPSYTQCVPDGYEWEGEEGEGQEEEGQMDENERIALQEAEDERIARELMQNEESERKRREQEDMELARRMQEEESAGGGRRPKPTDHSGDVEIARRLQLEDEARKKAAHERDMELARRLHQEEVEARKKKATGSPKPSRQQHDPDVELAMRLQREEVMRHKELKKQKLAQQRVLEAQAQEQCSKQQQQQSPQQVRKQQQQQQQPRAQQKQNGSPFAGYELPPEEPHPPQQPSGRSARMEVDGERGGGQPSSGAQQQGMPPDGHPFNPAAASFYAYQPGMAGVQVPRTVKTTAAAPSQARPYKRAPESSKKKKK